MFTENEKNYLHGFIKNSDKPENIKLTHIDNSYIMYDINTIIGVMKITFNDSIYGYVNYLGICKINDKKIKTEEIINPELLNWRNEDYNFLNALYALSKI